MGRFATALILAASALPLTQASATDTLSPELQPFAFLAGSCWRAPMSDGNVTDTHCFAPILNGHFLRDRHIVNSQPQPYRGETIYRWDPAARKIRFDYYSSEGLMMSGTAAGREQGLTFELSYVSEGRPIEMRIAWNRAGADAYVVSQEVRTNGAWRPVPNQPRFERVGPAPAD